MIREHAAPPGDGRVAICDGCDLAQWVPIAATHWRCVRCRVSRHLPRAPALSALRAWAFTGLICLGVTTLFPLLSIRVDGAVHPATLWGATAGLWETGRESLALLVAATTLAIPLLQLALVLYVLSGIDHGRRAPCLAVAVDVVVALRPWNLLEVFLLGLLVSIAKLGHLATIVPGMALLAVVGLIVSMAVLANAFGPQLLTPTP